MLTKREIPWFGPEMVGGELSRLGEVLESNFLNDGPLTRQFEEQIAAICGVREAVAVTSGTIAIFAALMALGIGSGDEVLVPDLTFIATANAVALTGATVVLVDIEPIRFGLDIAACEQALTPRTRAIVSVDVNGRGANYRDLLPFVDEHGLYLVCDAAEALGSYYDGRPIGSFGKAGCLSFSANKTVTTGQGGMVVTNDEALAQRIREIKDQGRVRRGTGGDDDHPNLGFNFKFTDIQAAVGLAQLDALELRLDRMGARDLAYASRLADLPGLELPDYGSEHGEVRQWTDVLVEDKGSLRAALDGRRIGNRAFWHPLHTQGPYRRDPSMFPNATEVSRKGVWLASHFSMSVDQIDYVCDVIRANLRRD